MKTLIRLLTLAAIATFFALPAFAQDAAAAAPADPCTTAGEDDLYKKYYDEKNTKRDQAAAYETAKQYLAKYPTCTDRYTSNVKKFHDAYKAAVGDANLKKDFDAAVVAKDARKTHDLGKQILANEPTNVKVALLMANTGYNGVIAKGKDGDPALAAETAAAAGKALQMLEAGNEPKDADGKVSWAPFTGKDDALGWAHYWAGALQYQTNPDESAKHLITVAQSTSSAKLEPTVYTLLAVAYEKEREKLAEEYKKFTEENDQSRIVLANINQVVDRQIDAYARAVAFVKPDDLRRAGWMDTLKALYKSRNNNSEAGLDQKIVTVKTTPLLITTPVTTAPAVPANGNGTQPTATAEKKP